MDASYIFKTKWGWIGLRATPRGIGKIALPRASRRSVEAELKKEASAANGHLKRSTESPGKPGTERRAKRVLTEARQEVLRFLSGQARHLRVPIDLRGASSFQKRVWLAAQRIPYGRARSYQWVAARVGGKHYARAVGAALGANPVPLIVPCHRVVAHDGSLRGFAGGLQLKRRLLELEGTLPQLRQKGRRSKALRPGRV